MRKTKLTMLHLLAILLINLIFGCNNSANKINTKGDFKYMIILDKQTQWTRNRLKNHRENGEHKFRYNWVDLGPRDTVFVVQEGGGMAEEEMDYLVKFKGVQGWIGQDMYDVFIKKGTIKY